MLGPNHSSARVIEDDEAIRYYSSAVGTGHLMIFSCGWNNAGTWDDHDC